MKTRLLKLCLGISVVLACLVTTAAADPRLVLVEENDAFALFTQRDYGYTQGVRASAVWGDLSRSSLPGQAFDSLSGLLPAPSGSGQIIHQQLEWIALGQNIFTPSNLKTAIPDPRDRPYAGWLYTGLALSQETSGRQLDSFEVLFGVIGPASLADKVQIGFHNLQRELSGNAGVSSARWSHQLGNEPAALLAWDRRWKFATELTDGFGFDFIPAVGVAGGNVYTYASIGGMARFGRYLSSNWGPTRVRPAQSGASFVTPGEIGLDFGFALFAGVEGRAMARNVFLDGNSFANSPSVHKDLFVGDLYGGAEIFMRGGARLSFTMTKRSREFVNQPGGGDLFGSIQGSYKF